MTELPSVITTRGQTTKHIVKVPGFYNWLSTAILPDGGTAKSGLEFSKSPSVLGPPLEQLPTIMELNFFVVAGSIDANSLVKL
jgi:hypothetical protein